jgi:putative transposase
VVTPRQGRDAATFVQQEFGFGQRRACHVVGIHRSTYRLKSRRPNEDDLRDRLRALAAKRPRFGYRRLTLLLKREGCKVNHKRIYRLYREEGLAVRRKKRKRLVSASRIKPPPVTRANERWNMDFVEDQLSDGRKLRTLTIVDEFTRLCPRIEVDTNLGGERVVRALDELARLHGKPTWLRVDNGPEFIGKALDTWAFKNDVLLDFTRPGKPTDKAHVESFNGKFRDECLNQSYFLSVTDARDIIEAWRVDYNQNRPHSALRGLTPYEFALQVTAVRSPAAPDRQPPVPQYSSKHPYLPDSTF